jgi:hypothetical protein
LQAPLVRLLDGRVQPHLDPEALQLLHRDIVKVLIEPAYEPVLGLEQHYPGLKEGTPGGAFLEVSEEDSDLGG